MHSVRIRPASAADIAEMLAVDDDACALYAQAGLRFDFAADHPFPRAEYARWTLAASEGHAFLAVEPGGLAVGLMVLGRIDGGPYLDQLSVRLRAMRRGLGRRLVRQAIDWAGLEPLWLTTYAHLPWNRPFYESVGFASVAESECPSDILERLEVERQWLPAPGERIAMRHPGIRRASQEPVARTSTAPALT